MFHWTCQMLICLANLSCNRSSRSFPPTNEQESSLAMFVIWLHVKSHLVMLKKYILIYIYLFIFTRKKLLQKLNKVVTLIILVVRMKVSYRVVQVIFVTVIPPHKYLLSMVCWVSALQKTTLATDKWYKLNLFNYQCQVHYTSSFSHRRKCKTHIYVMSRYTCLCIQSKS